MVRPSRPRRLAHRLASLFGTDIPPTRGAKTDRRSVNRFGSELSTRDIEEFDREVKEDFRRKACMPHQAPQARSPPGTK